MERMMSITRGFPGFICLAGNLPTAVGHHPERGTIVKGVLRCLTEISV
jgi:hypothetical protein